MKYILSLLTFITPAITYAQDTAAVGTTGTPAITGATSQGVEGLIFQLLMLFAIFYFILLRPQQKKFKAHTQLTLGLKKGDKVVTGGGFAGTVTKSTEGDKFVDVEIANGIEVKVLRSAIIEILGDKAVTATPAPKKKKASVEKKPAEKKTKKK